MALNHCYHYYHYHHHYYYYCYHSVNVTGRSPGPSLLDTLLDSWTLYWTLYWTFSWTLYWKTHITTLNKKNIKRFEKNILTTNNMYTKNRNTSNNMLFFKHRKTNIFFAVFTKIKTLFPSHWRLLLAPLRLLDEETCLPPPRVLSQQINK